VSKLTKAAVVREVGGEFHMEDITLTELLPDEVLIEVHACGICHMDIEARNMMDIPCVLGHEGAGIVVETGAEVAEFQRGDRVIAGYGYCGHCGQCTESKPYFCDKGWELTFGGSRLDGSATMFDKDNKSIAGAFFQQSSFARHAITPARGLVRITDDVPWHIAAALPCGFLTGAGTALNVLEIDSASTLLVRGVGAVGLGAVVAAKMAGCKTIIAVDIRDNRLELAREFGATDTVNSDQANFDEWFEAEMPSGVSHALDTTGNKEVFENTIDCLATGGEMAYAILPAPMEEFTFKPFPLFVKCASLKAVSFGSAVPADFLPKLLEWWSNGTFPVESVITTFPFEDLNEAVDAVSSGRIIKPVLLME